MNIENSRVSYKNPISITVFSIEELSTLAALARKGVFEICLTANHGHVGGSTSAVELLIALYFGGVLRFNPSNPADSCRDRVLVRGHLGPLRYKLFSWLGWLEEQELLTYRRIGSRLHGHEDHLNTPGVDISPSGSLGMLLSYGVGAALGARDIEEGFRTFVFLGDGEEQEGIVSEAARHAAHLKLGNLIAIIDRNGKQLSNPVVEIDSASLATTWEGYGWRVVCLPDGHNVESIVSTYKEVLKETVIEGQPTLIIADTIKGIGLEGAEEHFSGFHTLSRVRTEVVQAGVVAINQRLDPEQVRAVLGKMDAIRGVQCELGDVVRWEPVHLDIRPTLETPNHPDDCQVSYFRELHRLINDKVLLVNDLYFLTADVTTKETVSRLRLSQMFHFHNVGIREQHMVAMAHGLSVVRPETHILINSFDAFTYRCIDQINAALQGHGHMIFIGDVAGITNSRNGKTHQTTGLPAALLSMDGLTYLEPWDAADTFACLNWAFGESRRVVYIRVHSSSVRYNPDELVKRTLGYYTVRDTRRNPNIVLVGAGLTVDSCIAASESLKAEGLEARVINVVNPNSLDENFGALVVGGCPVLTVYNGHPRVLRQAVADALLRWRVYPSVVQGLGFTIGNTGTFSEMLEWSGIDGNGVYDAAKSLL